VLKRIRQVIHDNADARVLIVDWVAPKATTPTTSS